MKRKRKFPKGNKIKVEKGKHRNSVSVSGAMINRRADRIPDRKKNKDLVEDLEEWEDDEEH